MDGEPGQTGSAGRFLCVTALTTHLCDIRPDVTTSRLLADLVPPPHFADVTFDSYVPNPGFPSQAQAQEALRAFAGTVTPGAAGQRSGLAGLLRKRKQRSTAIYLDGGFGVGKTHLLASLGHQVGHDACAYGTFVEFTNLVGALGFATTVETLATRAVVCIDEFELDDPGDTVLMSRLLRELTDRAVSVVATSNTLPESLGEGRFAADDFLREIQALAQRFTVLRLDGPDYRHRDTVVDLEPVSDERTLAAAARSAAGKRVTVDAFDDVLAHLSRVHPSRYGAMLDGIDVVALTGVHQLTDQNQGLRLVVLIDRLYDRDVHVLIGSRSAATVFTDEMLRGGYRKKYFRALSRLGALAAGS